MFILWPNLPLTPGTLPLKSSTRIKRGRDEDEDEDEDEEGRGRHLNLKP